MINQFQVVTDDISVNMAVVITKLAEVITEFNKLEAKLERERSNVESDKWPKDMAGVTLATPDSSPSVNIDEIKAKVCKKYRLFTADLVVDAVATCHDTLEDAKVWAQQISEIHHTNVDVCMVIGTYKSSVVYEEPQ